MHGRHGTPHLSCPPTARVRNSSASSSRPPATSQVAISCAADVATQLSLSIRRISLPCFLAILLFLFASPTRGADEASDPAALFLKGQYADAATAAEKAIASSEFLESPRLWKLRSEMELGRYAEALVTLEAALKRFPGSIELRWFGRDVYRFNNQPQRAEVLETEIDANIRTTPWRYSDGVNRIIVGKFLIARGLDAKQVLDGIYTPLKRQLASLVPAQLATGELALDKGDYALAAQAFQQAIKAVPSHPEAHFGLARAFAPSEPEEADKALQATLERNPNHIGAMLLATESFVDSERYDEADKVLLQITRINPHHPLANAFKAILAHLRNQPEQEQAFRELALKYWATNPEVDYTIGRKLSQKYRFSEGAAHQRQALKFAPKYLPATMQLAQDLLRLGQEDEGWKLAQQVYAADGYNITAHNLVSLKESVASFRTLEQDGILVRMDARESEIYGPRVLELLTRAKRELCAKYDVTLPEPIIIEMFPKQEDFAIRTFGMPGGAGFLGVCFGTVITANSPASQAGSDTCWESTLWHEFCHAVTLNKTRNRMPRWLSEGISVYEERLAHPAWGQRLTPQTRKLLLGDELTPVDKLSGAFLRPPSPQHLLFAYYESSLVVEFLVATYGIDALKKVLDDLALGITINEALDRHTESLGKLNEKFVQFARDTAEKMAPQADWSEPELPRRIQPEQALAWLKEHPKNYQGLQRLAQHLVAARQWEAAKTPLQAMRELYPDDAGADSLYPLLARVHRELNEPAEERAALEKLVALSDDNLEAITRLCALTAAAGEWPQTQQYVERWLAVNPLQPAAHRYAAQAAEQLGNAEQSAASYRALLVLDPVDRADLYLRLSQSLERSGDLPGARRQALLAVEEAPRFREAHRHLLALDRRLAAAENVTSTTGTPLPSAAATASDRPPPPALPESTAEVP